MKNETPEDWEANVRLMKSARARYESMRVALEATVERLQSDDIPSVKDVNSSVKDYGSSLQAVINIEANFAKRSYEQRSGGEGACPLDLAAARREVIERLVKLAGSR